MHDLLRAYRVAHKYREEWYNIKWRAIVILVSVAFILFVYQYLDLKYYFYVQDYDFFLSERLFNWFMIGSLFGIIAVGMIFEGEFLLGLRNISKELADAERKILKADKPKAATKRRK